MPITTMMNSDCPVIRLTGSIDMPVGYALLDEIKLLHDYYQFRTIELEIDSPGGDVDALHYIVQALAPWIRGEGRVLKTRALNQAASAGAMLLSFGTLGHRAASPHSRLLYHNMRTSFADGSSHTLAQLKAREKSLGVWERRFIDLLVEHVGHGQNKAAYRKRLGRLINQERYITASVAHELRLIDKVE